MGPRLQNALMGNDIVGIAGHVKHLDARMRAGHGLVDFRAFHGGHDHIREKQINPGLMGFCQLEGLFLVLRADHMAVGAV